MPNVTGIFVSSRHSLHQENLEIWYRQFTCYRNSWDASLSCCFLWIIFCFLPGIAVSWYFSSFWSLFLSYCSRAALCFMSFGLWTVELSGLGDELPVIQAWLLSWYIYICTYRYTNLKTFFHCKLLFFVFILLLVSLLTCWAILLNVHFFNLY